MSTVDIDRDEFDAIKGAASRRERLYGEDAPTELDLAGES